MYNKSKNIPVNIMPPGTREGIMVMKMSFDGLPDNKEVERPHRDNGHLLILQEKGSTHIEVDFKTYEIRESSVMYIHPDQIHRLLNFEQAVTTSLIITVENLSRQNLQLLESLKTANALSIPPETFALIAAMGSLCVQFSARKHEKLYDVILKESCNTLVSLCASQYLAASRSEDTYARYEVITKSFKAVLERNFIRNRKPKYYAKKLHFSEPYLNECVKAATGQPVSYHIQERSMLEAKRLLYHSTKSVKEIAVELGYDDYSYFIRRFVKLTGTTPVDFRAKNFD